ncbi:MAG: beta-lactamase family protein [Acidobacteria bacterium]|nr:beta-lactamase family protein [Acidobacteriota bacterium]
MPAGRLGRRYVTVLMNWTTRAAVGSGPVAARSGSSVLQEFLEGHLRSGTFPGGVAVVAEGDRILAEAVDGLAVLEPERREVRRDTIFDLASLTKPLATTLIAILLSEAGVVDLAGRVRDHFPEFDGGGRGEVRLRDLLLHRSGLPAWTPLYLGDGGRDGAIRRLLGLPLEAPPGRRVVYGCPAFLLLGIVLEKVSGRGLDRLFRERVAAPLRLRHTGFLPGAGLRDRIAATERGAAFERGRAGAAGAGWRGWRTEMIWGEVHDGNAHGFGGVAGNAGLFGTAPELIRLAREFTAAGTGLVPEKWRRSFRRNATPGKGEARSPGWQLAASGGSAGHGVLPAASFGHTGFTGVSLWVEPGRSRIYVLLTNRVHPEARPTDMNAVRRDFHRAAAGIRA